jgi:AGZA family xanthine/uracil permease-like MFS transporter
VLGKSRQVHPMMWLTAGLFAVYFLIAPLTDLVT